MNLLSYVVATSAIALSVTSAALHSARLPTEDVQCSETDEKAHPKALEIEIVLSLRLKAGPREHARHWPCCYANSLEKAHLPTE